MNPNASPETSQQKPIPLHPKLQSALSSFNVDLEEEVNRFRQSQQSQQDDSNSDPKAELSSSSVSGSLTYNRSQSSQISETEDMIDSEIVEDYLASSEELLQGINQTQGKETQKAHVEPSYKTTSWRDYLLTPLGVAGILIFFLSGSLLTIVLINLQQTRVGNSSSPSQSTADQTETLPEQKETNPADESSQIPNRPNLANDVFGELNTDNLVEAEPAEEVSNPTKPSCGENFYCVIIENPTQAEYRQTRQLARDAYLREFPEVGQVLQAGAFESQSRAEQLQQRLAQQGLSAKIYEP